METHDIVIVGGGSAGLATGGAPARPGSRAARARGRPRAGRRVARALRPAAPAHAAPPLRPAGHADPAPLRPLGRARRPDRVLPALRRAARPRSAHRRPRGAHRPRRRRLARSRPRSGTMRAEDVIVATGYNGAPFVPDWPGREAFTGRARPLVGVREPGAVPRPRRARRRRRKLRRGDRARRHRRRRRTLAALGAHAAADRAPRDRGHPRAADRDGDQAGAAALGRSDLEDAAEALDSRSLGAGPAAPGAGIRTSFIATGTTPILDVGIVDAVRRGRVEVVAAVEGFDGADVLLADGSRIIARRGDRGDRLSRRPRRARRAPRRARRARPAGRDRRRARAPRALVRRLHADARRTAARGEHRRARRSRRGWRRREAQEPSRDGSAETLQIARS